MNGKFVKYIDFFKIFLVFLWIFPSIISTENKSNNLNYAINEFKKGNLELTKKILFNLVLEDTTIQNNKDYLKLQYILHLLENQYYQAEKYYFLLESMDVKDDFLIYLRILQAFNFNQYKEIENLLNQFKKDGVLENNQISLLPFICNYNDEDYLIENRIKNKKLAYFWRENITKKEWELIEFLSNIFQGKNKQIILTKIFECINYNNSYKKIYHLYQLLLMMDSSSQNLFYFYEFLIRNQNYLEGLHILRKIYYGDFFKVSEYEYYIILLSLKKTYEKLNYPKQVDTLERFLSYMEEKNFKNYDIIELKKIATENLDLREFLYFLYLHSDTKEEKEFYLNKIKDYDLKYDYREKISYYKTIYPYFPYNN
jgi:hypothetical protein